MNGFPSSTTQPGWPEFICDSVGDNYCLLRDGTPTGDFTGHACLYGLLDEDGYLVKEHLYTPTLGSTPDSCVMTGGVWMDAGDMVKAGVPPIRLPPEPVSVPVTVPPRYPVDARLLGELANRFRYHAPARGQSERYEKIRGEILNLALLICHNAPESRERATALTHLDSCMMFANAAIARNEPLQP